MRAKRMLIGGLVAMFVCLQGVYADEVYNSRPDTLNIDGTDDYAVYNNISYYGDTQLLNIHAIIQKADSGYFKPMPGKTLNMGYTNKYYWTRISMRNTSPNTLKVLWVFLNPAINELELLKVNADTVVSLGTSGDHYPFFHRPIAFNLIAYPLTLAPGECADYYSFMDKKGENFKTGFRLVSEKYFYRFGFLQYFIVGILTGTLVLVFMFNLFLFYSLKDSVHGWYSLYVVVAIMLLLTFQEMDFQFLYPNFPAFCDISRITFCGLNLFLMLFVMRRFYHLAAENSRFYRIVMFLQWFTLVFTAGNVLVYKVVPSLQLKYIYMLLFSVMTVSCMAAVTATSVEKIKQGFKPAYFYLSAVSFLFLGGVNYLFTLFGWFSNFTEHLNGIQVGIVLETVSISFGILYRYNLFKREKEKLALELETNKTQTSVQLIATQEAERKRIASDLHDDLGGNLASIKMNLQSLPINAAQIEPVIRLLDRASEDVRNISHNLMPPEFSETSLGKLLQSRYNDLNSKGSTQFNFHCNGQTSRFNKIDDLMIYRIVNELTNNILKHAQASEATIQLIYYDTYLAIMAEDNGKGITNRDSDGIGLKNIQSRVDYLGGKLDIHSNSFGTTVIVNINYRK